MGTAEQPRLPGMDDEPQGARPVDRAAEPVAGEAVPAGSVPEDAAVPEHVASAAGEAVDTVDGAGEAGDVDEPGAASEDASDEQEPARDERGAVATPVEPSAVEPSADEPSADEPSADEPSFGEPSFGEPSFGELAADEPAGGEPVAEDAGGDEPAAEHAGGDEPAAEHAGGDEPPAEDAAADEPVAEDMAVDGPVPDDTGGNEPAGEDAAADGPVAEEAGGDEPAVEEAAADEPAAEDTAADEPVADEPAADGPADDAAAAEPVLEPSAEAGARALEEQESEGTAEVAASEVAASEVAASGAAASGAAPSGAAPSEPDTDEIPLAAPRPAPLHRPRERARTRLLEAMKPKLNRGQLLAALLCAGLGFGLVTQIQNTQSNDLSQLSQSDLVQLLQKINGDADRLADSEAKARAERELVVVDETNGKAAEDQLRRRLEVLGILAGTVQATGPGIRLDITDPKGGVDAATLLDALQELRDAGAEAVQINGVRVVASTAFEDLDGGVRIGGEAVRPPYQYLVVGDKATLAAAMQIPGGVLDVVDQKGGKGTVTELDRVDITALHHIQPPQYARPAPEGSP